IRMGVFRIIARAMAIRCRWPPESVMPRSPRTVLYPSGNFSINSLAFANSAAFKICSRCLWFSVRDVLPYRRMEQHGFLQNKAELLTQRFLPELPYVGAVDLDRSGNRIVKTRNQADDRSFPGAGGTNQSGYLSGFDLKAHI